MQFDIQRTYQELKDRLNKRIGERDTIRRKLTEVESRLQSIDKSIDDSEKASIFLQTLSDETRQQIIEKISGIVTDALQKVIDPDLQFKMILSTERNQVDIKFVVKDSKLEKEYDILNSYGGGMADIITFPLKVSLLLKWSPELARIMILDENFAKVDAENREHLGEFVRQLSEKLNLQIILVTHSPELESKAHKIFKVSKTGKTSKIQEIESES